MISTNRKRKFVTTCINAGELGPCSKRSLFSSSSDDNVIFKLPNSKLFNSSNKDQLKFQKILHCLLVMDFLLFVPAPILKSIAEYATATIVYCTECIKGNEVLCLKSEQNINYVISSSSSYTDRNTRKSIRRIACQACMKDNKVIGGNCVRCLRPHFKSDLFTECELCGSTVDEIYNSKQDGNNDVTLQLCNSCFKEVHKVGTCAHCKLDLVCRDAIRGFVCSKCNSQFCDDCYYYKFLPHDNMFADCETCKKQYCIQCNSSTENSNKLQSRLQNQFEAKIDRNRRRREGKLKPVDFGCDVCHHYYYNCGCVELYNTPFCQLYNQVCKYCYSRLDSLDEDHWLRCNFQRGVKFDVVEDLCCQWKQCKCEFNSESGDVNGEEQQQQTCVQCGLFYCTFHIELRIGVDGRGSLLCNECFVGNMQRELVLQEGEIYSIVRL